MSVVGTLMLRLLRPAAGLVAAGLVTSLLGAVAGPARVQAGTLDVPSAPTGLTATPNQQRTQYDLSWTAPMADTARAAVTGYKIEHSADGNTPWATLTTVGSTTTAYSDTGLTANTTRYYRVVATSAAGDSGPSNIAPTPALAVYLKTDTSAVVTSLPKAGSYTFTVKGAHWTGGVVGGLGVLLTACLVTVANVDPTGVGAEVHTRRWLSRRHAAPVRLTARMPTGFS